MTYKPFPIYDYTSGITLSRDPWLIPQDAFEVVYNFVIDQGKAYKRFGTEFFGDLVHYFTGDQIGTGDGTSTSFSGTVSNTPVRSGDPDGTFKVYVAGGSQEIYDQGDGTLYSVDGDGTIDYETGNISVTFDSAPANGNAIQVDYNQRPENAILGIYSHWDTAGSRQLLAFDKKRMCQWFTSQQLFQDVTESDIFSQADDESYIHFEAWNDKSYITNGEDEIKVWDGAAISTLSTDINDDGSNDIDRTHLVFSYKGRLVVLRPTENGQIYPQRVRWTATGTDNDFYNGGYVDAPALDWIVAAAFLKDKLIVCFERSIWALNYTGDVDLPFEWEKLIATEGASAPMSIVPFANEIMFLGPVRFISTDGMSSETLNADLPDFTLQFDAEHYNLVYGAVLEESNMVIWTYPEIGDTYPTHNLMFNYKNSAWLRWNIPIQVIGYYTEAGDRTWDNTWLAWNDIEFTWDAKETQAGYPTVLGGARDGKIHTLNKTSSDPGSAPIEGVLRTAELNPFRDKGRRARLGYLDIYHNIDPDTVITVKIYEGDNLTPYYTYDLTLNSPDGAYRKWSRLIVNGVADGHQIEFYNNAKHEAFTLHAFVPWMSPAGRLRRCV